MKNIYLCLFIGITAIVMTVISFMNFDPKIEKWSSFFAGLAVGLLLVMFNPIKARFTAKRQRSAE